MKPRTMTIEVDISPSIIKDRHTETTISVRYNFPGEGGWVTVMQLHMAGAVTDEHRDAITKGIFDAAIGGIKDLELKITQPMIAKIMGLIQ